MSYNDFNYTWDDRLHDGMGGWRITHREDEPFRDADDFLTALKRKLS